MPPVPVSGTLPDAQRRPRSKPRELQAAVSVGLKKDDEPDQEAKTRLQKLKGAYEEGNPSAEPVCDGKPQRSLGTHIKRHPPPSPAESNDTVKRNLATYVKSLSGACPPCLFRAALRASGPCWAFDAR